MRYLIPAIMFIVLLPSLIRADPAAEAYALMVMRLSLDAKPAASPPCGKVNCDCGCREGNTCVCAVKPAPAPETHNYDVGGGKVVRASSWEEAYKKAGIAQDAPQAAIPAPVVRSAYPTFQTSYSPSYAFPGAYAPMSYGYSAPSYAGGNCGAGG